jgi:methionyl-tRNA formyltransferase
MRLVLVGAVEGSRVALDALISAGHAPALVVTLPADLCDRHSDFADITRPALDAGCEVFHTSDINDGATIAAISRIRPDLVLVIGWSQICRQPFREIARLGTIGYHPAALPHLRGRGVIPWTILLGRKTTGSTLFWIDEGTDTGPILLQQAIQVGEDETALSLYRKHMAAMKQMIPQAIKALMSGNPPRVGQQHDLASYCAKRTPADGLIDWREPAARILTLIRAVGEPYPGAFTYDRGLKIVVDTASEYPVADRYFGIPGQVQAHSETGFLVMCGDGRCIDVTRFRSQGAKRPPIHGKLDDFSGQAGNPIVLQQQAPFARQANG